MPVWKIRSLANIVFNPDVKESGCWLFHLEALMVGSHRSEERMLDSQELNLVTSRS